MATSQQASAKQASLVASRKATLAAEHPSGYFVPTKSGGTTYVSVQSPSTIPQQYWGTSSAQYGEVSATGQIVKTPDQISQEAGLTKPTGVNIPQQYWGTSSAKYGEVSTTGKVIQSPEQVYQTTTGMVSPTERARQYFTNIAQQQTTSIEQQRKKYGTYGGLSYTATPKDYSTKLPSMLSGFAGGISLLKMYVGEKIRPEQLAYKTEFLIPSNQQLKKTEYSFLTIGASALKETSEIVLSPIKKTREISSGLFQLVTKPRETLTTLVSEAQLSPTTFIGKQIPYFLLSKYVGVPIKERIKTSFKKEVLEIPQMKGESKKFNIYGIQTKGGRAFVLKGVPNIVEELKLLSPSSEIKIGSALETKVLKKGLKKLETTERAKELIPLSQKIFRQTEKTKSRFIDEVKLKEATQRLPEAGVKIFLDIAKKEQSVLFGSKSRAAQLASEYNILNEKYKLTKVPRDIEIRFDLLEEKDLQGIIEPAIKELRKLGTIKEKGVTFELGTARQIREKGILEMSIEAKVGGKYEKVFEAKGKKGLLEKEEVPEFVVGIRKVGKPKKLGGIKITTLAEELRGVGQGILRIRKSDKGIFDIYPSPKREKDIGSFSVSARTLQMSKLFGKQKLQKRIERFEGLFPKKLVREQVEKVLKEPQKEVIASFKKEKPIFSYITAKNLPKTYNIGISPKMINKYISKSKSEFKSVSKSTSKSISVSKSKSVSLSKSLSMSKSISKSPSQSLYKSFSVSISRTPYPSKSFSPYKPKSKSISPSISPSYSISRISSIIPPPKPPSFKLDKESEKQFKKLYEIKERKYTLRYAPSLFGIELGKTISKAPKYTEAIGIRLPVAMTGRNRRFVI